MYKEIPLAPVLHPTVKEFANFHEYIELIEKQYSSQYGMVKVVPPKTWKARTQDYEQSIDSTLIQGPIEQNPFGKGGIYECLLIQKKSMTLKDYRKKSLQFNNITDGKSIEQVEEMFWKNISFSPKIYGADMNSSLFDEGIKWNMRNLDSILNDGLNQVTITGVNKPYIYVGQWKTMFAWHKEDLDLGAINYLHHGKPKFWYAIAQQDEGILENIAKQYFADSFAKCSEFLRHKTTVINPYLLVKKQKNLRISKMVQNQGEFIVVFPGAYHHGFNYGFNIAEAVNYACLSWLGIFQRAKHCRCISDSVKIDQDQFIQNLLAKKSYLKNDPQVKQFIANINKKNQGKISKGKDISSTDVSKHSSKNNSPLKDLKSKNQHEMPAIKKKIKKNSSGESTKQLQQEERRQLLLRRTNATNKTALNNKKRQKAQNRSSSPDQGSSTNDESEKIQNWIQCDNCKKWRQFSQKSKTVGKKNNQKFHCKNIKGLNCGIPQEDLSNYVTIKN